MKASICPGKIILAATLLLSGHAPFFAQEPDVAAQQAARRLRAQAAYHEMKGDKEKAAKLYEESLKFLPDAAISAKIGQLRGETPPPGETKPESPPTPDPGKVTPPVVPPTENANPGNAPANSVRRKINEQCPELADFVLEVEGLTGEIAGGSVEDKFFAGFRPGAAGVRETEQRRFGGEYTEWVDEGPHVVRTGYAKDGEKITLRLMCPEKPAMAAPGEGVETVVTGRGISFAVHNAVEAKDTEVALEEDNRGGTLSWTPRKSPASGQICGPTAIGVYVDYRVERQVKGESMGVLSGGRHRVGWVLIASDGMMICVDRRIHTVRGPATPAEPRMGWELPAPPAAPGPGVLLEMPQQEMRKANMRFSQDMRRRAQVVEKEGADFVVVDGKTSPAYKAVYGLEFSKDGNVVRYEAEVGPWKFMVLNGREGRAYKTLGQMKATPDGLHVAYVGADSYEPAGGEIILDEKVLATLDKGEIKELAISADGAKVAWIVNDGSVCTVVLNGQTWATSDTGTFRRLQFAPAGHGLVCQLQKDGKDFLVADGKTLELPCSSKEPVFSPDGGRLGYVAVVDGGETVVVDGVAGKTYPSIWDKPAFSPDGRRVGYIVSDFENNKAWAVVDGVEGPKARNRWAVTTPVFSPDGARAAYAVEIEEGKSVLYLDGKEAGTGKKIMRPGFSPDGKRMAWFDTSEAGTAAVVDGVPGPAARDLFTEEPVQFSPDGANHFTFTRADGKFSLLVNHNEAYKADIIVPKILFPEPGKFRFVAVEGDQMKLVELPLP